MKKENSNKDNNSPFKQFNFKFNFYWIYGIIFALTDRVSVAKQL